MARNANAIEQERGRDVFKATQDGVWGRETALWSSGGLHRGQWGGRREERGDSRRVRDKKARQGGRKPFSMSSRRSGLGVGEVIGGRLAIVNVNTFEGARLHGSRIKRARLAVSIKSNSH